MRLFSKFVVICNGCFIVALILRWVEMLKRKDGNFDAAIPFQPLESSLVVLGYTAILFNLIFLLIFIFSSLLNKKPDIPKRILVFNMVLFPLQVYFFFFT